MIGPLYRKAIETREELRKPVILIAFLLLQTAAFDNFALKTVQHVHDVVVAILRAGGSRTFHLWFVDS